jgi:hypothetical protein
MHTHHLTFYALSLFLSVPPTTEEKAKQMRVHISKEILSSEMKYVHNLDFLIKVHPPPAPCSFSLDLRSGHPH